MTKEFSVELDNNKITDYEHLLSRFSNWKKYKREINLNQLLDSGKKIEFEVEIPNSQTVFYINILTNIMDTKGACATIKKLTFIILENKVIDLKISADILKTTFGNILSNIVKSDIELKLYQYTTLEGKITEFYFNLPNQAA